eukprot:403371372
MYGQPFRLTFKGQNKLGFDIAFGGYDYIDPRYGSVQVNKTTKVRQYNEISGQFEEVVEIVKCGYSNFNYPRKNESAYQDVTNLLCIKDKSFLRLGGAWTTNRLEELNICLQPCENTTTSKNCASQKQQDEFFRMVDFQLRFVNQYFDFADMNNPVKSFIEDRYFLPLILDQQKSLVIFIKKAFTKLNDNFIPFVPQQTLKFSLVDHVEQYTSRLDYYGKCYAKFILRMDLESDLYTRQVYTIADLLSDLGGIYSSLFALGAILNETIADISQNQSEYRFIEHHTQILRDKYFREIVKTSFSCIRKKTLDEKRHDDQYRKIFLFKKGVKKINNEFDGISLIKLMKQMKLLTSIILNPTQKLLLGFSQKNLLDSENSQNESEEDDVKIVKSLRSQNNFIKLMALFKVKKNLSEYLKKESKLKTTDERLINGVLYKYKNQLQQYTLKSQSQSDLQLRDI